MGGDLLPFAPNYETGPFCIGTRSAMIGLWELFQKGGPIMWPILLLSIVTGGVVLERLWFLLTVGRRAKSGGVKEVFGAPGAAIF